MSKSKSEDRVLVKSKKHDMYGAISDGNKFIQHKWISFNKAPGVGGDLGQFQHKPAKEVDPNDFEEISYNEYETLCYEDSKKI